MVVLFNIIIFLSLSLSLSVSLCLCFFLSLCLFLCLFLSLSLSLSLSLFLSLSLSSTCIQIVKVSSVEKLLRHVDRRQVTVELGGNINYKHDEWLTLRLVRAPNHYTCIRQYGEGGEDLVIHVLLYKVILCIEVVYVLVCLYCY